MPFGGFALLSVFYAVLGIRFASEFIPKRREIFDRTFTAYDRSMVTQAAFFFLLPVSVALHELGHALAIWLYGGEVLDIEYYVFAGAVSYDPTFFSDAERMLVAFAGTLVNLLLIAAAMGVVLFKSRPLPAPYNELLVQFSLISGINALVLYPALDYFSGMSGDWTQMYEGGVPWLTGVIVAIQASSIGVWYWISRDQGMRARLAKRTGGGTGSLRRQRAGQHPAPETSALEQSMSNAASRVASGWPSSLRARHLRTPNGPALALEWDGAGPVRFVVMHAVADGGVALAGGHDTQADSQNGRVAKQRKLWLRGPSEDELTLELRLAMELVEREASQALP